MKTVSKPWPHRRSRSKIPSRALSELGYTLLEEVTWGVAVMGVPEPYAGWGLSSVYLAALLIAWTAVIAGFLALLRRLDEGHDHSPVSRSDGPEERKAA